MTRALLLVILCLAVGGTTRLLGNTADEASEDTEVDNAAGKVSPTPSKKTSKGGPQVEIGIPSAHVGASSIFSPPSHLDAAVRSPTPRNFIVAIDIGHTRARGGAVSARGVSEYKFNRTLGGELFAALRSDGFPHTLMINPNGDEIGLIKRAQVANDHKADVFLAIHHDSVKESFLKSWTVDGKPQKYCDDFHGYSIFFSRKNVAAAASQAFALDLGEALLQAGFKPTLHHVAQEHRPIIDPAKGVYAFDDLLVLKNAKMPAVLLECGVIVNRNEEQELATPTYRTHMIGAIQGALARYADTAAVAVKKTGDKVAAEKKEGAATPSAAKPRDKN